MTHIAVIGAGQAGASLVAKLRAEGFDGAITLFGEEPAPPYQRPPLSKAYLLGKMDRERLFLRPESWYADNGVTLRTDTRIDSVDAAAKTLTAGGETVAWDKLALCTGSRPRMLPETMGGALQGVAPLRTLADVDALRPLAVEGKRALIVGGGYIGLEAAAVLRGLGLDVTLLEAAERILQRVAAPETSAYYRALHGAHGVDLREGAALARITGEGHATGADLADGSVVPADFVLVGIGVIANAELAAAAGLDVDAGAIVADLHGRTSHPDIVAAGDCTLFPWRGAMTRLESVQNAIDQAENAALTLLDKPVDYDPVPWFWSDQYDVKLQIAGLNRGHDRTFTRAGAREGSQSVWYYRGAELLAVDAMNDPRSYMMGKRWLEAGKSPDPDALADPASDLRTL